ncbi:probable serine/threonine-protein kinase DDB_G0282963 isoform X3 [Apis laboriosa]|uniref:probable serine/threonine-protein kinase DDB_G0282963 isoform X3 n=1 Tax=Apis laboriosa TaxID=183418 RepID=UPI001CC41C16|nr:probable serine/threonine-protein kinase DDB_G0282963 isoform X3 [Apis laboriosa]
MPQILKHRKVKKPQKRVLSKRRHFLTNYRETRSYKPLCKQLKMNNNSLAKALSREKHECQLLFSQNVALIAEVQNLGSACTKRDAIISNVLKNAKEMLKMLVTMTSYLTNTISSCQEFTDSVANMRMSFNSAGKRESIKRLSTKSPTRGVVKPMVSGYTITKPTINLSRLNMQYINNSSNLSIIPEVTTPPRNQEGSSLRSPPNGVSERRNCKNGRTYRMPERLTVTSPEDNDENGRKLSERSSRHSGSISGKLSKSKSRLSRNSNSRNSSSRNSSSRNSTSRNNSSRNSNSRYSIENFEHIGSPRVKLNDVSKLLQNSHTINIRMLTENQNNRETNTSKHICDMNLEDSQTQIIQEMSSSNESEQNNNEKIESKDEQSNNELDITDLKEKKKINETKNCTSNWEDPLEGPSWLFNNSQVVPSVTNKNNKTDNINISNEDIVSLTESSDIFDEEKTMSMSITHSSQLYNSNNSKQMNDENEFDISQQNENNTFRNVTLLTDANDDEYKFQNASTMNLQNFVTQRRGYFESEDEDDFTLIYTQRPCNMNFDINDLKLPVLEQSTLKPNITVEPEPEITTTLRQISQIYPIPSVSHNTLDESEFNQSTVKLPLLANNDYDDKELTILKKKSKSSRQKKVKIVQTQCNDFVETSLLKKNNCQKKKKDKFVKDPSAVKVVLQKLDEFDVKSNEILSLNSSQSFSYSRPRRKRVPINFHEPSLKKKLRRNQ